MKMFAAVSFALVASAVVAFQMALTLGAPWGELTMGGRWSGRLPAKARLIPAISALVLAFFAAVTLARAGYAVPLLREHAEFLAWVVVGGCALGCAANAATPSRRERRLWLPIVLLMLVLSLVVATSS